MNSGRDRHAKNTVKCEGCGPVENRKIKGRTIAPYNCSQKKSLMHTSQLLTVSAASRRLPPETVIEEFVSIETIASILMQQNVEDMN
jgi:hypothetical protein